MLTIRIRTRSPRFTSSGVADGPARPLMVNQLKSISSVFGTSLFGRSAHSWKMRPKSRSTRGVYASRGCMMKRPIIPSISCIAMCE